MSSEFNLDDDLEDLSLELEREYGLEEPTSEEVKHAAEQEISEIEDILDSSIKKLEYTALDNPSNTMTYTFATATGALTLATGAYYSPPIAVLGASLVGMGVLQFGRLYRESIDDLEEDLEAYNNFLDHL